jgi:hypothetical protein
MPSSASLVIASAGLQVHHLALGQIGGRVENEAAIVDVGLERLHRFGIWPSFGSDATDHQIMGLFPEERSRRGP